MNRLKKLTLVLCILSFAFPRPAEAGFRDWLPTWLGGRAEAAPQPPSESQRPKNNHKKQNPNRKKKARKAHRKKYKKYLKRKAQKNSPPSKEVRISSVPVAASPAARQAPSKAVGKKWDVPLVRVAQAGVILVSVASLIPGATGDSSGGGLTCPTCPDSSAVPPISTLVNVGATAVATVALHNWRAVLDNLAYTWKKFAGCVQDSCSCCCGQRKVNHVKKMFSEGIPDGVLGMLVGIIRIAQYYALETDPHYEDRWIKFKLKTAAITFQGLVTGHELPCELDDSLAVLSSKGVLPFVNAHDFLRTKTSDQKATELEIVKALAEQRLVSSKRRNTKSQEAMGAEFFKNIDKWYKENQIIVEVAYDPAAHKNPQKLTTKLEVWTWEFCGARAVARLVIEDNSPSSDSVRLAQQWLALEQQRAAAMPRSSATSTTDLGSALLAPPTLQLRRAHTAASAMSDTDIEMGSPHSTAASTTSATSAAAMLHPHQHRTGRGQRGAGTGVNGIDDD